MTTPTRIVLAIFALASQHALASSVHVTIIDDATGRPIAGACVARMIASATPLPPTPVGVTDADGAIPLDVDPAERSGFLATKSGVCATTFGFWGAVPRAHEVRARASVADAGLVLNVDGTPAAGATVELVDPYVRVARAINLRDPTPLALCRTTTADGSGRFHFDVDPSEPLPGTLRARVAGAAAESLLWTASTRRALADGTFAIRLGAPTTRSPLVAPATRPAAPPLTIRLRVVDDATGVPIRDVRVTPGGSTSPDQAMMLRAKGALRFVDEPLVWTFNDGAWSYFLLVSADGYAATSTRIVKGTEGSADVEVRLKPARRASLALLTADGAPASGASLYLSLPYQPTIVPLATSPTDAPPFARADAEGVATLDLPDGPCRAAIAHAAGWAEVDLTQGPLDRRAVKLTPWASATVHVGDGGPIGRPLTLDAQSGYSQDAGCWIDWSSDGELDANGTIELPRLREGSFFGMVMSDAGSVTTQTIASPDWAYFDVAATPLAAGEHREMRVMNGRACVRARLTELPGQTWNAISLSYARPLPTTAPSTGPSTAPVSPPAPRAFARSIYLKPTTLGEVGTGGLMPGVYRLMAYAEADPNRADSKSVQIDRFINVAEGAAVDVGTLGSESFKRSLAVGDAAPALIATTLDGPPFDLAAMRGRGVLLDFWGTWCGFCVAEEPTYRDAFEGWGADGRLTMVSLAVDDTPEKVREHLKAHAMPWTHVVLGDRAQTDVPTRFGVEGYPTVMLISPEGKLVAGDLRGGELRDALIRFLGPASPPSPATRPGR